MKSPITLALTIILVLGLSASAKAGILMDLHACYMQGVLNAGESFSIGGACGGFEGGYQFDFGSLKLGTGILARYSDLTYKTNGLTKVGKWYTGSLFASAGLIVSNSALLRLKAAYPGYSRFFVTSGTSVTVNGDDERVEEHTMFSGGTGAECGLGLIWMRPHARKRNLAAFWGVELAGASQSFNKRQQRTVIKRTDEEKVESREIMSESYRLSAAILAVNIGVEF
jgi:hypothetical protein